jgi:hypothetical protein
MRPFGAYKSALLASVTALAGLLLSATPALAKAGPIWSIQSVADPTIMQTSDDAGALVKVNAEGGTFTLSYEGQTTVPIAYDASDASVESALDALSSIGGVGGSASVTGGPAQVTANNLPYGVMFAGALHGVSAARMTADGASLSGGSHTVTVAAATNDEYVLHFENIGDTASSLETITVTDKLPPGVTTTETPVRVGQDLNQKAPFTCSSGAGLSAITCTGAESIPAGASESYNNHLVTETGRGTVEIAIPVTVASDASGSVTNTATVSGGGAARSASVATSNLVNSSTPPAFGVSYLNALVSDEAGAPFTQAGGHPYGVTVNFGFNQEIGPGKVGAAPETNDELNGAINSVAEDGPREIVVDLPLGLVGDPLAAPRCPLADVAGGGANLTHCPRDTQVGIIYLSFLGNGRGGRRGCCAVWIGRAHPAWECRTGHRADPERPCTWCLYDVLR